MSDIEHGEDGVAVTESTGDDGSLIVAELAKAIREHRRRAGLTQTELAERAGIGRVYLSQVERAHKNPTVVVLVQLARGLGVQPGELLPS